MEAQPLWEYPGVACTDVRELWSQDFSNIDAIENVCGKEVHFQNGYCFILNLKASTSCIDFSVKNCLCTDK